MTTPRGNIWPLLAALLIWTTIRPDPAGAARAPAAEPEAAGWLQQAAATQAATRARLRVLGDAFSCTEARFVSYRRSSVEPELVDQWYVASQLWADAVLLLAASAETARPVAQLPAARDGAGPPAGPDRSEARCHLDKGFVFLDRLWDYDTGGYYPLSDPTGLRAERETRFGDDNALAGLALLATAETAGDASLRQRYLHAARRQAEFLTGGGLWDETFGGGFWWNTGKGDSIEGKPAQTNALAALFFGRLYSATGVEAHRAWALRTLLWLDTVLYDPARRLYRWSVRYEDPPNRAGAPVVSDQYFNYDQGIAIEAQLQAAGLDGDPGRLARARAIGRAVHRAFWEQEHGGYNLEAGVDQVYTAFAAWTSLGHLALYDVDGDTRWLELARANADALAAAHGEPDGGYAYRRYRCVGTGSLGCESGDVEWVVDHTRDTVAQALMQHLQAAIGRRSALRVPSGAT